MENIHLHFPYNREEFIQEHLFRYHLVTKSYKKQWTQLFILIPILFIATTLNHGKPLPFNFFAILTLFSFIFGYWLYATSNIKKKGYNKKVLHYADKYDELQLECHFEFSDLEFKYWDNEKHFYYKWHCLTRFSYEENYIVLWIENNPQFIINRHQLKPAIKTQLEKLLHEKIPFSESKISSSKKKNSDELIDQ
ncbi:MAG: hypothetical protein QE487_09490 [Fluviicola sp.]|nr:hypothetical protein [Fluviicola sp.]